MTSSRLLVFATQKVIKIPETDSDSVEDKTVLGIHEDLCALIVETQKPFNQTRLAQRFFTPKVLLNVACTAAPETVDQ